MMWGIFEIAINVFESFIIYEFLTAYLLPNRTGREKEFWFCVFWLVSVVEVSIVNHLVIYEGIAVLIPFAISFLYALLFLQGSIFKKLFASILIIVVVMAISVLTLSVLSWIFGERIYDLMSEQSNFRAADLIITKILLFYVTRVIIRSRNQTEVFNRDWVLIMVIPVTSVLTICLIADLSLYTTVHQSYAFFAVIGILITNMITYYLFTRIQKDYEAQIKLQLLDNQQHYQVQKIQEVNELYEEVKILRHDLRNHNLALLALLNDHKIDEVKLTIQRSMDMLDASRHYVSSGYTIVDGIINMKISLAEQNQITTSINVNMTLGHIDEMDVGIILGNLLDNALEYFEQNPETSNKRVKISIKNINQMLLIGIKNTIGESVLKKNPYLQSSKRDIHNHGLGMQSVRNLMNKYEGEIEHYEADGFFCVNILLNM